MQIKLNQQKRARWIDDRGRKKESKRFRGRFVAWIRQIGYISYGNNKQIMFRRNDLNEGSKLLKGQLVEYEVGFDDDHKRKIAQNVTIVIDEDKENKRREREERRRSFGERLGADVTALRDPLAARCSWSSSTCTCRTRWWAA